MELTHEFQVGISVPEAWKVLTDVERIAPMLPGAQLQEVEGDEYRGVVRVKVGPITAQYRGKATFVERDEAAGRVVLNASGRDTRGQGNASALITATMTPESDGTRVSVVTDLTVTGKVAQFGRGVLAEVSQKLVGQFVDALHADLAGRGSRADAGAGDTDSPFGEDAAPDPISPATVAAGAVVEDADAGAATGAATSPAGLGAGSGSTPSAASAPAEGVRKVTSAPAEPVDLLRVAGGSTLKRLAPVLAVVAVILLIVSRRRTRWR